MIQPYDDAKAARAAYERERRKRARAAKTGEFSDAARPARNARRADAARRETQTRPFVSIDSEGVSFGPLVEIDGAQCQKQRTVLWGAASSDAGPLWLCPAQQGRAENPYCASEEILDWLVGLPAFFGPAIFVWFGSSYDATQIFADLPYEKAWELQHGKPYPKDGDEMDVSNGGNSNRFVLWGKFALCYLKQKFLTICLLRDRNNPRNSKTGKFEFLAQITIFDVFGFFQCSFIEAAKSIPGAMSHAQAEIIESGKKLRGDFTIYDLRMIQKYTKCELIVMAQMMTALRETLLKLDLPITRWQGAGSIAGALLKRQGAKEHFRKPDAVELTDPQTWAHHAFFGGRIELLKQGAQNGGLWNYDIRSAYPHHMRLLPSMADGVFRHVEKPDYASVGSASLFSMFKINFRVEVDLNNPARLNKMHGVFDGPEFYPLPYRDKRGIITYPPRVYGVYMQAEASAAIAWLEFFKARYEKAAKNACPFPVTLEIEEAYFFEKAPGAPSDPFSFLQQMYDERLAIKRREKETGIYDLTEKVIKIAVNSCYGKTAQSVGQMGKPPGTACPWVAAAITAGARAQLLRAALTVDPSKIVAFMTDGIVCQKQLNVEAGVLLGQWEETKIDARAIFVQPGVYHIGKKSKHRGIKAALLRDGIDDFFEEKCVGGWRDGVKAFSYPYRAYISLGTAVASRERWDLAGFWADGTRDIFLDNLGHKRLAPISKKRERHKQLISTLPLPAYFHDRKINCSSCVLALSEIYSPDWIDAEFGILQGLAKIEEEIAMTEGS
jgi:hypothetical protein